MNNVKLKYSEFFDSLYAHKVNVWNLIQRIAEINPKKGKDYFNEYRELDALTSRRFIEAYNSLLAIFDLEEEVQNEIIS